jgi:hypothetical protein
LDKLLASDYGVANEMEQWDEFFPLEISSNGLTLLGTGTRTSGETYVWLLDLDRPLQSDVEGDFDVNGMLDVNDVNRLTTAVAEGQSLTAYDLTADGDFTVDDLNYWTKTLANTWTGDVNLEGLFNSSDLVAVLAAGKYESGTPALWSEGDWNADGRFSTNDLVVAFQDGGYEQGPRAGVQAVPEPGGAALMWITLALLGWLRRDGAN